VIVALVFMVGVACGALLNALWDDVVELLDLYREERR
jgi:hypothetical protein